MREGWQLDKIAAWRDQTNCQPSQTLPARTFYRMKVCLGIGQNWIGKGVD